MSWIKCPCCGTAVVLQGDGLTEKQKQLLDYIRSYIAEHDYSPSFEEMKDAVGLKSKSGVHRIVTALIEKHWIVSPPGRARSIALLPHVGASR